MISDIKRVTSPAKMATTKSKVVSTANALGNLAFLSKKLTIGLIQKAIMIPIIKG
ncbi:hypothetical protein GCM10008967_24980 [Bacillus carboniphilus]|uniref:Uncharacterized protein n=1 Tax=Bacillus carboniphilus TaxID=86663 RepID=A0ABP3G1Y2_9BACI